MEFPRIKRLPPYVFNVIGDLCLKARRAGDDIIDFGMGNPDLATPPHIVSKLIEAASKPANHRYSVSRGVYKLRLAIADWYKRRYGVELDPDSEAIVTIGSKEGLAHLAIAALDQGDVVLAPTPTYPIHQYGCIIAGAQVHGVPIGNGEDFFEAGDIREGNLLHQGMGVYVRRLDQFADRDDIVAAQVAKDPNARGYLVNLRVEMPELRAGGSVRRVYQSTDAFYDLHGFLKFADRPEDAPIIHFRGPREATLYGRQRLTVGRETDLDVGVATPGLGPGTTVWTRHDDLVPKEGFLTAEVVYPPGRAGRAPVRELYELKKRC